MSEQGKYWFVARIRKGRALFVRSALEKSGVECFIPTRFVERQLKHCRRRVEIPVFGNLIFIKTTREEISSLSDSYAVLLHCTADLQNEDVLIIPEQQIRNLISLTGTACPMIIMEDTLVTNAHAKIVQGDLCGLEGEFCRMSDNRTYLMVRVEGMLKAGIEVSEDCLKIIND